jgi:hypothetical protein
LVHAIIRRAYNNLPQSIQKTIKSVSKTGVERRRSIRGMEALVRSTIQLANVRAAVSTAPADVDDRDLVARLLKAYQLAVAEDHRSGDSMWTEFFQNMHGEIHTVFMSGDVDASARILRDPGRTNLFYGFDSLSADFVRLASSRRWRQAYANASADSLARLAEALGAIRYPYPDAYSVGYGKPPVIDPEVCLKAIQECLGAEITIPNPFPDEHGFATGQGVVSYRMAQALYQAHRISQLVQDIRNPAVLEIGGGLGRTASYARQLGIADYTIVDLPLSSLSQGYFLGRTLGADHLAVLGEGDCDVPAAVKIVSPKHFLDGKKKYDLIINVDSLTEMSREVASAYLDRIISGSARFLSINHEFNPFTVRELLQQRQLKHPVIRTPYAMRDGYVEEYAVLGS